MCYFAFRCVLLLWKSDIFLSRVFSRSSIPRIASRICWSRFPEPISAMFGVVACFVVEALANGISISLSELFLHGCIFSSSSAFPSLATSVDLTPFFSNPRFCSSERSSFHCEPPGQNVSIVSQICLILVSNCLKRSQFYLKHVSDKMSQFGLNLRPFWHLRHNWDCPHLRAIWEQFETLFCVVKMVSKRDLGGFSGWTVFSGT